MLRLQSFTVGPFAENPYLVSCTETNQAILIDPGDEPDMLWQAIVEAQVELLAIVLTHAHLDHVGAVEILRQRAQVPVYLHPADDLLLANVVQQGRMFGLQLTPVAPAERQLAHDDRMSCGQLEFRIQHTPGHSPGSVCLYFPHEQTLIAGDTLFQRSVGRTDLPGGDARQLFSSIETQLWPLPDDVRVYPGHGPATTIGEERELNPFVGTRATSGR